MRNWIAGVAQSRPFWLWVYAALLLLPSALISGDGLGKALYPLLIVMSLAWNYRRFFWAMLGFYLLAPFALYYELSYRVPPETSLWLTLLGSSTTEAGDYLSHINYWLAAATLLPYVVLLPLLYRHLPSRRFSLSQLWRIAGILLLLVPVLRFHKEKDPVDGYLSVYRHYKQSYPLNFLLGYPAAKIEIGRVKALVATQQNVACTLDDAAEAGARTVVMVIGESARRDRHSIFGYRRNNTTPLLSRHSDQLWAFSDVVSTSFETTSSVPGILTGNFGDNSHLHPSFVTAFRNAGFRTYWFSNQAQFGEYDSLVSAYAAAADRRVFLHQHSYSVSLSAIYDEALLPYLDAALKDDAKRRLVVLHIYGSHADFSKRYPAAFNRFSDPYDNSILYTDYVLSKIIDRVAADGGSSAVMYVADHGVNLEKCPGKSYHMDEKSNYEVPMLMWASPQWRSRNSGLVQQLTAAKARPLTTETVMPSLLGMAHVSCPAVSRERSIFSEAALRPRMVNTFAGSVAYDRAVDDDECHLVEKASVIAPSVQAE